MPEDNINPNINPSNIPNNVDATMGINPIEMNQTLNEDIVAGMSADEIQAALNSNPQPANVNFEDISGNAVNEVKIDTQPASNEPVTVRPVEFSQFDSYTPTNTDTNKNLELLMDIKLELTVELGRCQLPVKKVLELTRGSIIELDKVAGESVELFANGKHVANGEVVVIEDNFGLRITSITDPEERIKSL